MRDDLPLLAAAALPLALFLIVERTIAGTSGFPLDDSWIHLHFARNIAEGHGFAFNPGRPVAGSTAPLWTLVLAAGAFVAGPSVALAKVLGVAVRARGCDGDPARGAGVGRAPGRGAAGGRRAAVGRAGRVGRPLGHGGDAGGAAGGRRAPRAGPRPDGVDGRARLLRGAWRDPKPCCSCRSSRWRGRSAPGGSPCSSSCRPSRWRRLVAFAWVTVGAPFPATGAAKVEGGLIGWLGGLREPAGRDAARPAVGLHARVGGLAPADARALAPGGATGDCPSPGGATAASGIVGLALLAHPLGMALLAPYRGPGFQEGRYSTHLLPLALVVLAVGLGRVIEHRRRAVPAVWLALALWALVPAAQRYAWGVQNIDAMQVRLGRWVDANVPRRARLAVNDIGAIAYFSRREVLDLMGLVTPEILPYRRQGEDGIIRFVGEVCPDYVIVFPAWFPQLTARADLLEPVHRVALARVETSGGPEMIVYRLRRCAV